jgi:phosphatidylinositol 3-kinase
MFNINSYQQKINLITNNSKFQLEADLIKKSQYLDNYIHKPSIFSNKENHLDIELKPIFFYDKSMSIIINYLKTNKFIFDSNNFDLFIDTVLCANYLQINPLLFEIRSHFIDLLNSDINTKFNLVNIHYDNEQNNLTCSIADSDILQINKLVKDIRQRRLMKPVHDDSIHHCYQCNKTFSIYIRKHHCRACGRIFCYKCSAKQIEIPEEEKSLLPDDNWFYSDVFSYFSGTNKVRVCDKCYAEIDEQKKFSRISQCFQYLFLDIITLKQIAVINYEWKKGVIFCLSLLRELQYRLPTKEFSQNERVLLWMNRGYFSGHSKWLYQLLRVLDWDNEYIYNELIVILKGEKKYICGEIFCTKYCRDNINFIDIIYLLNLYWKKNSGGENIIVEYLIDQLKKMNDNELLLVLPYFIEIVKYSNKLIEILFEKCQDEYIFYQTYLLLNFNNGLNEYEIIKQQLLFNMTNVNKQYVNNILSTINMISILDLANQKSNDNLNTYISYLRLVGSKYFIPFKNSHYIKKILYDDISIKISYTKPKFIPYINDVTNQQNAILFKHEDLRKDLIIMNLIKYTKNILDKEEINVPVITYDIIPINKDCGIVEIVQNCSNLFEINNINTFLVRHNQDKQIGEINDMYMRSLAYWTIITYLFGVGDRHLENIMITTNGVVFHIDFSFILGQEAKILVPYIRMSEDLINVMGGRDARYKEFKELCGKIFICLRKYYIEFCELFLLLLDFRIPIEYLNFKGSYIEDQIITRFLPGLSDREALSIIDDLIENSCDTFGQKMSDYLHYYYKQGTGSSKDDLTKMYLSKMKNWFK